MTHENHLTLEDKRFIEEFIADVIEELVLGYDLKPKETDKIIKESVFLELMKEDPEYVVNHDVGYWAERIYGARKCVFQMN